MEGIINEELKDDSFFYHPCNKSLLIGILIGLTLSTFLELYTRTKTSLEKIEESGLNLNNFKWLKDFFFSFIGNVLEKNDKIEEKLEIVINKLAKIEEKIEIEKKLDPIKTNSVKFNTISNEKLHSISSLVSENLINRKNGNIKLEKTERVDILKDVPIPNPPFEEKEESEEYEYTEILKK